MGGGRGSFVGRYGAWALVAGASEGLGAAFARALGGRGMSLVLVARRAGPLGELAAECRSRFGVETLALEGDLGSRAFLDSLPGAIGERELGLVVYNAAFAPAGDFAALGMIELDRVVDVNVRGPLSLLQAFLPPMLARGRGAFVFMSSLAGNQGSPGLAAYAASKAFNRVLAEGLWRELGGRGIDLLACCAGAIRTPGFEASGIKPPPGTLDPARVAESALRGLGRGPLAVPGLVNKLAAWTMVRLLPRRAAIGIMDRSSKGRPA
jgi:uncharacterized protein